MPLPARPHFAFPFGRQPLTAPIAPNLVPRPSFEYDTLGGAPADWANRPAGWPFLGLGSTTLTITAPNPKFGAQCLRVDAAAFTGAGTSLGILPPGRYTASCYVRGNVGGEIVRLGAGAAGVIANGDDTTVTASDWVRLSVAFTSDGASESFVGVRNEGGTSTFHIDAAMVTTGALTPYFDGDFPGCSWVGAPGDSVSSPPRPPTAVRTVEQGSTEHIMAQANVVAYCPIGYRQDRPEFGWPWPDLQVLPIDSAPLVDAINRYLGPQAKAVAEIDPDALANAALGIQNMNIDIQIPSGGDATGASQEDD